MNLRCNKLVMRNRLFSMLPFSKVQRLHRCAAFTLIEMLIVLLIFTILSAIALPTVRKLLVDQKTTKAASAITSLLDLARSRAISEGRYAGVRFERVGFLNTVEYGSAASLTVRQIVGVPPYSGESGNARVEVVTTSGSRFAELRFPAADNMLLSLGDIRTGPVKSRDIIELANGQRFHLLFDVGTFGSPINGKIPSPPLPDPTSVIRARINLRSPEDGTVEPARLADSSIAADVSQPASTFPSSVGVAANRNMKFRIHRTPVVSSSPPVTLTRGVAVDLNYSGFGVSGNEFMPEALPSGSANQPVDILFGPDGRVEFCSLNNEGSPGSPPGLIFLCVGSTDGVRPDDLLSVEKRATANILNSNSIWVVINPNTGRAVAAPIATVNRSTLSTVEAAISQARSLALLSDTLDSQP